MAKQKFAKFPCGCRVPLADGRESVFGKPSVIYEVQHAPMDCEETWDLISSGRTKGIFQLESPLGRQWARRLKPRNMEHLSALLSLLRPGCLKAKDERGISMTELYCMRKNEEEEVVVDIEAVRDILEPTYNVMCYQEQMMQIAQKVAGFDLVEVDKLRKAAGKKDQQLMADIGRLFVAKAADLGVISREEAERLFENIRKSGRYLFNKAHAVSYAYLSYWTAHEKAHFPLYFFTSYLRYARTKQDPQKEVKALINDAKHFDIVVVPPRFEDIHRHFHTNGVEVRFGFADVKGIGLKKIDKMRDVIREASAEVGEPTRWSWLEFLVNFADHIDHKSVRRMIEVGSIRQIDMPRQQMIHELDAWHRLTKAQRRQVGLLSQPLYKTQMMKETVTVEVDDFDKDAMKEYRQSKKDWKKKYERWMIQKGINDKDDSPPAEPEHPPAIGRKKVKRKVGKKGKDGKVLREPVCGPTGDPVVLDPPRVVETLADALQGILERPGAVKGERQRAKVGTVRKFLLQPPRDLRDTPHWIAAVEEVALGVPLTCTHVDSADKSICNTTCKDFHNGRDDDFMVIAAQIDDAREVVVKNGKNIGATMCFLSISDETGSMEDVVMFSDAYMAYGNIVHRIGSVVGVQGKRDYRNKTSFIVDRIWEI